MSNSLRWQWLICLFPYQFHISGCKQRQQTRWARTVSVVRSKHTNTFKTFLAALISFFTFSTTFFVFPRKSYWENTLFNSLACKRCFNTSLRLHNNYVWLRTWLWKLTTWHFLRYVSNLTPHLTCHSTYPTHMSDFNQILGAFLRDERTAS